MPITVVETPVAIAQVAALRGPSRRAYEHFLDELSHRGCAALSYRVTGPEPLPRLCVRHLRGADRVVVAFNQADSAYVLLVGPHDADPGLDVYELLYRLVGVRPSDSTKRTKPSCCDPGTGTTPTAAAEIVDDLCRRARTIARSRRRF
ncbi:hypothetical protein M8C13_42350 [Crossiella sp. SN42]|uniref:hypothetical protein n=1 Tax=Crossiella sp. SN42 TaxID=2944808 RepID=UPI00207C27CA|nr:hypothetical protein [Crossiella sp. SN42]MCO1582411.1 hypothetical protein [Crossiella sp. SN42]